MGQRADDIIYGSKFRFICALLMTLYAIKTAGSRDGSASGGAKVEQRLEMRYDYEEKCKRHGICK